MSVAEGLSSVEQEYNPTPIIHEIRSHVATWRRLTNPANWGITPGEHVTWTAPALERSHVLMRPTGWASRQRAKRTVLAVVLAYALALQSLLTGLGGGQHAARAHDLDAPLGAVCAPGPDGGAQGGSSPAPAHDSGGSGLCCVLICGSGAPALGAQGTSVPPRAGRITDILVLPARAEPVLARSELLPLEARAPPVLA